MTVWILSESEQQDIVSLYRTNALSQKQLAQHFGCSTTTIRNVLKAKRIPLIRRPIVHISTARLIAFAEEHQLTVVSLHKLIYGESNDSLTPHA